MDHSPKSASIVLAIVGILAFFCLATIQALADDKAEGFRFVGISKMHRQSLVPGKVL